MIASLTGSDIWLLELIGTFVRGSTTRTRPLTKHPERHPSRGLDQPVPVVSPATLGALGWQHVHPTGRREPRMPPTFAEGTVRLTTPPSYDAQEPPASATRGLPDPADLADAAGRDVLVAALEDSDLHLVQPVD